MVLSFAEGETLVTGRLARRRRGACISATCTPCWCMAFGPFAWRPHADAYRRRGQAARGCRCGPAHGWTTCIGSASTGMANRCSNPSTLNDMNTLSNACARKVCCTPVSARVPTFAPPRPPTRATASWCTPHVPPPAARPSRRGPCPSVSRRPAFHPYRHAETGSGRKATYSA